MRQGLPVQKEALAAAERGAEQGSLQRRRGLRLPRGLPSADQSPLQALVILQTLRGKSWTETGQEAEAGAAAWKR